MTTEVKRPMSMSPEKKRVSMTDKLRNALSDAQFGTKNHGRSLQTCQQLYANDPKAFWNDFVPCLHRPLVVGKKEPAVESFVKFVVLLGTKISAEADVRDEFTNKLFR